MSKGPAQRGAALLVFFFLMFLAAAGVMLGTADAFVSDARRETRGLQALDEAKHALIEYAVNYATIYGPTGAGPGHLPCPDRNGDGFADGNCGPHSIGFLPRKLSSVAYEFSADRTLPIWYAVADTFKFNPSIKVNSESVGTLVLDGENDIAAVLIWPGAALAHQTQPSTRATDYLEGENANGDAIFSTVKTSTANDVVIPIRRAEIMKMVEGRVLGTLHALARDYETACGTFPFAVPYGSPRAVPVFDSVTGTTHGLFPVHHAAPHDWGHGCANGLVPPTWVTENNWHHLAYIATCPGGGACLIANGSPTRAVVVLAGAALAGQTRHSASTLTDYFEAENADGTSPFAATAPGAFNDIMLTIN